MDGIARIEIPEIAMRVPTAGAPFYPAAGASVQVNIRGAGTATVYTAATGPETRTNPLTVDAGGRIDGYLEPGSYDLVVTDGALSYTQPFEAVTASGVGDASATVKGITRLSVAPAVAAAPIALGSNDPLLAAKANLSSGKVPTTELGGAGADNTRFLRGDQTWGVPAGGGGGGAESGDALQPGVLTAAHCALTINSTSQVTVAAGVVWVTNAGGVLVRTTPPSTVLATIPVAANNRLDQIVVDSAGVVTRLAGTSDLAGNTLDNRTGAAAIPAGSRLLHDLLVTAGGVTTANRRDRRPWARGAFRRILYTGGNRTTNSATFTDVDAVNLKPRIECSGNPVLMSLEAATTHSVASAMDSLGFAIDGVLVDGASGAPFQVREDVSAGLANSRQPRWHSVPAAGSHLIGPQFAVVTAGTMTVVATATVPVVLTIEEIVRQNASNDNA